jgi:hypothetical protein
MSPFTARLSSPALRFFQHPPYGLYHANWSLLGFIGFANWSM